MGRASISIAITSNFNSGGIDAAIRKAEQLAATAIHYQGKFGKSAVDMGASMGQAAARLVSMGKAVADFGDKLTMGVTVPMGLAAAAAVTSAAKIDTAWYNVRKTVDMTEEGYQRLKQGAMELSEVQPVSAETILNIEALGGQLGITNDYLEDFAKVVSGLDIATNLDSDTAATELAQFRNIVQMSEDDLDNFASTLVDLGNHTATTEADMLQLALRFASAGHVAGMSNADILGLSAALSGLGMKAEAGGSALSRSINDISLSVAKGGEELQKWADLVGKTPEQFAEAWRNAPTDEFIEVLQAIGRDGADANEILNDLGITQIRQSDAMRRLASSGDLVKDSVERANQAWRENSALTREVENRNESLQARWDTLVNRFNNDLARIGQPLAEMGLNFLEGLEPAIQGVGDLTQAFANADPVVQRFAFNLAGIAMSAGPVLSVAGRLMQAVGNMGIRVGRVTQQWGVYQEAMNTTDISMLNTLSTNQSLAASFGASRNAIVKAAGGLDRYNLAYAKTTKAIRDRIEAEDRELVYQEAYRDAIENGNKTETEAVLIAEKAANSNKRKAETTKKVKAEIEELNKTTNASNVNAKLNTAAITEQEVAASKASRTFGKMGDALKGALIGFGASAAIGLAVAGITWLVSSMEEAAKRADMLDKATNGLRSSLTATGTAAEESGNSQRNLLSAIGETHEKVLTAIEDQSKLADAFVEVDKQAAVQMGTLDRSAEIIEKYANKGSIGAAQLSLLKSAIDDVNQACNTQYSVLEDGTVVYEGETGAIKANTDEILRNIDARKRQIQLEATESKYQAAYENLIEQQYAQADAVDKLAKARERLDELNSRPLSWEEILERDALAKEVTKLEQDVEEIGESFSAAADTERYWADMMESHGEKIQQLSHDMQALIDPSSDLAAGFAAAEKDVVEFVAACEQAGINFDFLNSLTTTEIQDMADKFDGSTQSIIRSLENLGKTQALEDLGNNWRNSIDSASRELADGIASAHDVSLAELGALATDLGVQGEEAMQSFLQGISNALDAGLSFDQASQLAQRISEEFKEGLNPDQAADIARNFLDNIARGMSDKSALDKAIQDFKNSLSQVDFTDAGNQAGTTFLAAFNGSLQQGTADSSLVWSDTGEIVGRKLSDGTIQGIDEGSANLPGAIDNMLNGAKPNLDAFGPYAQESGRQAGEGYGTGFSEGGAGAGSAADAVVQGLMSLLFGGVGQASDAGTQTGQGYGDAVSGQGSVAETAAMNTLGRLLAIWLLGIASAQQAGLRTGQAYGQGTTSGFVNAAVAAQATVATIASVLNSGVGPATAAGSQTGNGYGLALGTGLVSAATLTAAAVATIVAALRSGIAPATSAGQQTGSGYANAVANSATPAIARASTISRSTGAAFGDGRSAASAAGTSLGQAFASAVWSAGGQAISYARSIRDSVKSIFDNVPTMTVKVNVERTVTTKTPSSFGGHALQYAALPSPTPVIPVPGASTNRAASVAERAVNRIAARSTTASAPQVVATIADAAGRSAPAIDYDVMYRVVRSGVRAAIEESGGLSPVVELDGRVVSRQLAPQMDYELGRIQGLRR